VARPLRNPVIPTRHSEGMAQTWQGMDGPRRRVAATCPPRDYAGQPASGGRITGLLEAVQVQLLFTGLHRPVARSNKRGDSHRMTQ
jgi:hypothetical protein